MADVTPAHRVRRVEALTAAPLQLLVPVEQVPQGGRLRRRLQLSGPISGGPLSGKQVGTQRGAPLDGQVETELGCGVLEELLELAFMKFPSSCPSVMT